jgi:hypothetical protein
MKIKILPSAHRDLANGFAFYESQQEGLGSYFLESLMSDIDSLLLYGGTHRKVFGYYRLLSKRFPYAAYYSLEGEIFIVKAILDCRRDPERIKEAIEG